MINITDLEVRIGERTLISGLNLKIAKGMKIGLVGRNGAGKTTLTRILAEDTESLGSVEFSGNIHRNGLIGYLPQNPDEGDERQIVRDRILAVRGLDKLLSRIQQAEMAMSSLEGESQQKAMERYVRLDQEFTMQGGWAAEAEAAQIAASLGIDKEMFTKRRLGELSGGQRRRVELARVLFSHAQVLLLDEPTNHLDQESILWLRDYLRNFSGGFMVISHDVTLLDETVNQIVYLDAGRGVADIYHLGWRAYLEAREKDEERRRKERIAAEKKAASLREQGEKMRAKATKAVAAAQMLRRADELLAGLDDGPTQEKVAKLRFPAPAPCGKIVLEANGLSKSYGSTEVFTGINLALDRGSRVVVMGLNGAGKTTLLKILTGIEEADTGEISPGHGVKIGYYAQEHETIDNSLTVLENMYSVANDLDETSTRSVLGQFLFSGDDVFKPARVLSGGEKTRLALAMLVVSRANLLALDEPTNNLDPASREEILKALHLYEGAVILVTHDPGAVQALKPQRVLLLPEATEDLWNDEYLELVELS